MKKRGQTAPLFELHEASLLQRDEAVRTQDQVIEDLDAQGLPRVDEPSREEEILSGWFGRAGYAKLRITQVM